jgi:hypothetical protein
MERREFIAKAGLLATWATIPITITACSDDDDDPTGPDSNTDDVDGVVSVSAGHSHSVTLTGAQIDAGQNVVLTLTGSGHTHSVSLTADEVGDVADGTEVVKTSSSTDGHTHTVTFNDAPTPDVNGVVGESGGHSHSVRLTGAQIDAEQNVILTLTNSGHTHTVELSAQEVGEIGAGVQVVKTSSLEEGHSHSVTFN